MFILTRDWTIMSKWRARKHFYFQFSILFFNNRKMHAKETLFLSHEMHPKDNHFGPTSHPNVDSTHHRLHSRVWLPNIQVEILCKTPIPHIMQSCLIEHSELRQITFRNHVLNAHNQFQRVVERRLDALRCLFSQVRDLCLNKHASGTVSWWGMWGLLFVGFLYVWF